MRVVHCANFSESKLGSVFYAIDRKISNGLVRNGHFVYDYSYREFARCKALPLLKSRRVARANAGLLEVVENVRPHLLLLGHSELITTETLHAIRQQFPQVRIAMWWVDWVYNLKNLEARLECIDHFFITTDPVELHKWISEPGILNKCSYMPNICDQSMDIHKGFERDSYQYDVLFVGRYDEERQELVDYLQANLGEKKLGLFGSDRDSLLTGEDYLETIAASKIAINYNRDNAIRLYSSDRVIQLAGNGTLVLSPRIPGFEQVFSANEIGYFDDLPAMKQQIEYFLENDDLRRKVACAGWQCAHEKYNEIEVVRLMLEKVFA